MTLIEYLAARASNDAAMREQIYIYEKEQNERFLSLWKGSLKTKLVQSYEEVEAFFEELVEDFTSCAPVAMVMGYDGTDTVGVSEGTIIFIFDSGDGTFDNCLMASLYPSDVAFTSDLESAINKNTAFRNSYADSIVYKTINFTRSSAITSYADGTSFGKVPLNEFIILFSVTPNSDNQNILFIDLGNKLGTNSAALIVPDTMVGKECTGYGKIICTDDCILIEENLVDSDDNCYHTLKQVSNTTGTGEYIEYIRFSIKQSTLVVNAIYGRGVIGV